MHDIEQRDSRAAPASPDAWAATTFSLSPMSLAACLEPTPPMDARRLAGVDLELPLDEALS